MKNKVIFILLLTIQARLDAEGFRGDTLVYTPSGLHPISSITKGCQVYAYSAQGKLVLGKVLSTEKIETHMYDTLTINGDKIYADAHQPFFCPKRNAWVNLIDLDLQQDSALSLLEGPLPIENRQRTSTMLRNIKVPMYKIGVEEHQNFLITKQGILVHNYTEKQVPLSTILINNAIDFGIHIALAYVSDVVTRELAPKLKEACSALLPKIMLSGFTTHQINLKPTHNDLAQRLHDSNVNTELSTAQQKLINKLNAQPGIEKNSMMISQQPIEKIVLTQLAQDLAGPNAELSADGSYWYSSEKLANGDILTRRNHLPAKTLVTVCVPVKD